MTQPNRLESGIEARAASFRQDALDRLSHEASFDDLIDALTALGMWLCVARRLPDSQPLPQGSMSLGDVLAKAADQHRRAAEAVRRMRDHIAPQEPRQAGSGRPVHTTGRDSRATRAPNSAPIPHATLAGDTLG